jgi:hypothetical protein
MSEVTNPSYQFIIEEGKVYRIYPTIVTNIIPQIQIVGTGTVDLFGSLLVPISLDDSVLQSDESSVNLNGIYRFDELPNFIKFEPNASGSRQIVLSGFMEPQEIIFE